MKKATTFFIVGAALLVSVFALAFTGAVNLSFSDSEASTAQEETTQEDVNSASMADLLLDVGLSVTSPNATAGVSFVYTIGYSTISLTEEADQAVINLPLPQGMGFLGFSGTTDVDHTEVNTIMGVPTLQIFMVDPLEAGAAGIMSVEVVIPAGALCDGTVISNTVTFESPNALNTATASVDVTLEAPNPEWQVDVSATVIGVPGGPSVFDVTISPTTPVGYVGLGSGTVTLDIPANSTVVSCSGCSVSGNTLTWNVSNVTEDTSFPVVLNFPAPPFDFGDPIVLDAALDGTSLPGCPVTTSGTDQFSGNLPNPLPLVNCDLGFSEFEVGQSGEYSVGFGNSGNVAVDNYTVTVDIPEQINVTSIGGTAYTYAGINVDVYYTTNLNGPQLLGSFATALTPVGGFALPALGAGEYLTSLVYQFGTVPPGFASDSGFVLEYDVLATAQDGSTVIGANPRITDPLYVSCPNATYTCISPGITISGDYNGNNLSVNCSDSQVARTPPMGPGNPSKSATTGNTAFPGETVTYLLQFQVCGMDPLVNGLVTDMLPAGVTFDPMSIQYSANIPSAPAFNAAGQTLTWDFAGIDLPGAGPGEECSAFYQIQYDVVVDAVADGPASLTLTNSFNINGDGVDIPEAPLPSASHNLTIPPMGPTDQSKASTNGSAKNPGDLVDFRLRFRNRGGATTTNVTIIDILPLGLDFVPGSLTYSGGLLPPDTENYDSGTRTLTLTWATIPGAGPGEDFSPYYVIEYQAEIPQGFPPGTIQNCFSVDAQGTNIRTDLPLTACVDITINAVVEITSRKGIKGDCDLDFIFYDPNGPTPDANAGVYNGIGRTFSGGTADFKMVIENTGNVAVKDLTIIDILPYVGDMAVSAPFDRLSEWRPYLIGVQVDPMDGIDVYYTIEPNPCRTDFNPAYNPPGCTGPFWNTTPPVDISETQALKLFFNNEIQPGETKELIFKMLAPFSVPVGLVAWNSFAYQGRRTDTPGMEYFFVAEPNKVGIHIKPSPITVGNYVWVDENLDGIQNDGFASGVNEVEVTLYSTGIDGIKDGPGLGDDVEIGTKLTGNDAGNNPGYYVFPGLQVGSYYAVFNPATFPPGLIPPEDMPTLLNAGGDDEADSDADKTTMFMTDPTPFLDGTQGVSDLDLSLDLGLVPTNCELIPDITVVCDNRGTTTTNDDRYYWYINVERQVNGVVNNAGTYAMRVRNASDVEIDILVAQPYGTTIPNAPGFGPFPISGGDLTVRVKDDVDLTCEAVVTVKAPATLGFSGVSTTSCYYDGSNNSVYDLSGTIVVGGGDIPVNSLVEVYFTENGSLNQAFFDPNNPINFSFTGLSCNEETYTLYTRFVDDVTMNPIDDDLCDNSRAVNEPNCTITISVDNITACADGLYDITGSISTMNPANGPITISFTESGNPKTVSINPVDGLNQTWSVMGLVCDAEGSISVSASYDNLAPCSGSTTYTEPCPPFTPTSPYSTNICATTCASFDLTTEADASMGDVEFVYFNSQQANPYTAGGGTSMGTETPVAGVVHFPVGIPGYQFDTPGTYYVYGIWENPPADNNCRPAVEYEVVVDPLPDVDIVPVCGAFGDIDFQVTINSAGTYSVVFTDAVAAVSCVLPGPVGTFFVNQSGVAGGGATTTFNLPKGVYSVYVQDENGLMCSSITQTDATALDCLVSIGDMVWVDEDGDGTLDPGEEKVEGATVSLFTCNNGVKGPAYIDPATMMPAVMTTDNNGFYTFDDLPAGEYCVQFDVSTSTLPNANDYVFTYQGLGDPTTDSDVDQMGSTTCIYLAPGTDNPNVDAGVYDPIRVGDYVWEDLDGDGLQDPNEPGVGGVTVMLIGFGPDGVEGTADDIMATTTTMADGSYLFEDDPATGVPNDLPPGTYKVKFSNLPAGTVFTNPNLGDPVNDDDEDSDAELMSDPNDPPVAMTQPTFIPSGDEDLTLDAGIVEPVKVGDYVWEDLDGDGIQDPNEPGVGGVTVMLIGFGPDGVQGTADDIMATTTTMADGSYLFEDDPATAVPNDLPPGTYKVKFSNLPGDFTFTTPNLGDPMADDDKDSDAVLMSDPNDPPVAMSQTTFIPSGEEDLTLDAGIIDPVRVGDYVWEDLDGDGIQDANEPGVGGVTVMLTGFGPDGVQGTADDIMQSITTAGDGSYLFDNLPPGTYKVKFSNLPAGYVFTYPNLGDPMIDDDKDSDAVLMSNPNDPPVAMSQTTTISSGGEDLTLDAGIYDPVRVGDYVWEDVNGNGIQDDGNTGVNGVTVMLIGFGPDGVEGTADDIMEMTTTMDSPTGQPGWYLFEDDSSNPVPNDLPPGTYKVKFSNLPADFVFTFPNEGDPVNDDDEDSDAVLMSDPNDPPVAMTQPSFIPSGGEDLTLDAGIYEPASIGDYTWVDVDGDGIQDPNEPPLGDVKVTLTGTAGNGSPVIDPATGMDYMTTTQPDGSYIFDNLPPGDYKLTFMAPNGSQYLITYVNEGDDPSDNVEATDDSDADPAMGGMTATTTLISGEDDEDWDAGFYEPASIGDYVWDDSNNNGQQDPGELPIAGAKVTLTGTTGNGTTVLDPATGMEYMDFTEPDGSYLFDGLVPGNYKLTFDTPADLNPTKANEAGVADTDDSDADPVNGMTTLTFLESGEYDPTWDAGFFAVDFGDLPDAYGTTDAASGPKHIIIPQLYLGSCVDAETDGQDEAMAGLMDNGDDNNASSYGQPGSMGCADDEDGITFITPVVPGYEACIEIDVVNNTGAPAVLQGWLDFDGNFLMDDPADELTTGDFAGGGVTIPDGGVTDMVVCFDIPAGATYVMGDGFMRFRLSPNGGLDATGVNPDGSLPAGEVEDYKLPDVKIGNLIWEDRNYNGIQDPGIDDGINDIQVELMWAGPNDTFGDADDETYVTVSAPVTYVGMGPGGSDLVKDGIYYFEGLTPGEYKITVVTNRFATLQDVGGNAGDADLYDSDNENGEFFTITPQDVTNQILGEDGLYDMPGMTNADNPANSYPDAQDNLSFDFGYVGFDRGDLPESFVTLENVGMDGPRHYATPFWYMGACVDVDLNGQPDYTAGYYDALDPNNPESANEGDDNILGIVTLPLGVNCGDDDENGVILTTSMVPGYEACFDVNTTAPESGVMQAWIDFDGSLDFNADGSEAVVWLSSGTTEAAIPAGTGVTTELCFMVPAGATFPNLETHMRFRFSDQGGLDSKNPYANGDFPFGEVEDYYQPLAELGDYVWHDVNGDGVQDANEAPIEGTTVELHDCTDPNNPVIIATTTTNAAGWYEFIGLIPMEKYCVHFDVTTSNDPNANDYVFTFEDSPVGDETNNNDADAQGWTDPVMMDDRERNEDVDAGVYVPVSIGNFVWLDYDEDGAQDPDEPVIEGAKLFISGTNNIGADIPGPNMVPTGQPDPATMLMTNANGEYLFTGLAPGTYKITFDISMITGPAELERFAQLLVFTFQDNAADDVDSDVDPGGYDSPVGMSGFYTLLSGDQDLTVDGGVMVPCLPPTDIFVDMVMETTAIIHWTVNNEILDVDTYAHCWNIAIGNYGFEPWENEAVQLITVCADDPNIVINGDQVSYMVDGLAPGTCYDVYVQEGCNGEIPPTATHGWVNAPGTPQIGDILGNPLLATDTNPDGLCTFDYPHVVTTSATPPDCPWGSDNYIANGTLTVVIEDSPSCGPSTFTITVTPVANSTPGGTTPVAVSDSYIDVGAGSYTYTDLDAGEYHVSVLETGPCRPKVNPVEVTQEVPNAIDTEGPDKFVTDILGNEVLNIGPFILPEGSCDYQMQLYVQAIDGCYGFITAEDAVSVSATMIPGTVFPGTQASVTDDGFGNYLIDVQFAAGTTELTITVEDPDGNPTSMTYTVVVEEFNNPDVSIVGVDNITIPHCAESRDISFTVYVDDLCDQFVDFDNLTVCVYDLDDLANPICLDPDETFPLGGGELPGDGNGYGVYTLEVTPDMDGQYIEAFYTDGAGNVGVVTVQLTVDQADADEPALIYAADENMTIPYCEDTTPFCYSFQVYDDCAPVDVAEVIANFNQGGMGLDLDWVDDSNPNHVYFAYCGEIEAGIYFPVINYDGQSVQPLVNIQQQQNQAPTVILPGNLNFTVPVCEETVSQTFSIQISDDCDDLTLLESLYWEVGIQDYLGGPAPALTLQWFYFEGYLEITATFSADNDGNLLYATFTDSDGATTYVDSEINVTGQPDTWAPVLVYPSQDFDIELEACEDPEVEVCFYVTAHDNCDEYVSPTVTMDGQVLTAVGEDKYCVTVTPGDYVIDVSATDNSDNSSSETFEINVTQEEAPEDNLACIATVYATLEGDCSVELVASMVLNGEWSCLTDDDFDVVVMDDNPDNGGIIDGCGTFNYMITLAEGVEANFEVCWGEVTSEDKTSPEIDCPYATDHSLTSGAEFICSDIESILLDGVHYYTTNADGTIVEGSISSELAWILGETGYPEVSDNCGQLRVAVWDVLEETDCDYDVITRHFEVSDRYNSDCTGAPMTASCTQTISVRKADIDDVDMPEDIVEIECSDEVALTDEGYPHPSVTGYPSVTTAYGTYDLAATYCNLGAAYEDSDAIVVCESTYKVIRTWSIVDWCVEPAQVTEYTQIIKVEDTTAPEISCNWEDTDWDGHPDMPVYSTGPFDCTATFQIAAPEVTDNCSMYQWYVDVVILTEDYTYDQWGQVTGTQVVEQVLASYGPLGADEPGPYVTNIPMSEYGNHYLHYTAIDNCGNVSTYDCAFGVEDEINPVAICDDDLNISIGSDGYARVYAEDIDEGSNDNCQLTHIEVRRAGGEWGEYVDFDCEDVHEFVTIELRVWDAAGNSNLCWLEVLIEDKITPYCHAPHSVSMHCDDHELLHIDWDNADQLNDVFGAAWAEDNCNATAEQIAVSNNLNDCGWGTVVRTFQATDDWGLTSTNACTQVITIYEVHNYEIKFPKDADAECGVPNPDTLEYNTLGCDLITVNVNDEIYEATSDECYKILRTYKVINWCEWDGESDPIVIGRDEDCDNNPGDEDVWVNVRTEWNGDDPIFTAYVDRDNDETNTNPFIGTSRCTDLTKPNGHWANSTINTELTSVGHWQYTQVIKVYDFVAPTAVVAEYGAFCTECNLCGEMPELDCTGHVAIQFTVTELCDLDVVTAEGSLDAFADGIQDGPVTVTEVSRDEAAGTITFEIGGHYPIGVHSFGVHIEDGCHNITWLELPFEVVDCEAPLPVCINGLTVTLMPQPDGCCAMAIWATDFIASPIEDCTGPISYSIHRAADVADGSDIPSPETTGLVLDCEDEDETVVLIYAWDSAYNPYAVQPDGSVGGPNYHFCETYVLVQAHNDCDAPAPSMIAGTVQTEESEGVESAEVTLSGISSQVQTTVSSGGYAFDVVENGFDYTVTPHLDENPLNGVTTFDLVLITKHILGIQILDSPYKMIAADVNSSGSITTADMIQLRKLILGIYTDFPNNTSWRFVDADYVFPDPTNPWSEEFPESRNINNLSEDMLNEDFIAAKIGDVNGTATPNATVIEERNVNGIFALHTNDVDMKAGEQYTVDFRAEDLEDNQGYQFTMNFDRTEVSFDGIVYGLAQAENFGQRYLEEGMITTSWNAANGQTLKGDEILFSIVVTAQNNVQLSEVVSIGSRITQAEAYNAAGELQDVMFSFNGDDFASSFEVYQNTPNPFDTQTNIGYRLPEDAAVTITIQDVTGKTLKVLYQDGQKGYNFMMVEAKTIGATGTLYYTVATDKHIATRKMIVVE